MYWAIKAAATPAGEKGSTITAPATAPAPGRAAAQRRWPSHAAGWAAPGAIAYRKHPSYSPVDCGTAIGGHAGSMRS